MPMLDGDALRREGEEDSLETVLGRAAFFKGLPGSALAGFVAAAKPLMLAKGEHVYRQDDAAEFFYVIAKGWVRVYRSSADGHEAVATVAGPGMLIGEDAFTGAAHSHSAEAVSDAEAVALPSSTYRTAAAQHPELNPCAAAEFSRKLEAARLEAEHAALKTAPQRVACLLLKMTAGIKGVSGALDFPYDKRIAAQQLGMQRETFSRALSDLKAQGVHTHNDEMSIRDFAQLTQFTCLQCSAYPHKCPGPRMKTGNAAGRAVKKIAFIITGAWGHFIGDILEMF